MDNHESADSTSVWLAIISIVIVYFLLGPSCAGTLLFLIIFYALLK